MSTTNFRCGRACACAELLQIRTRNMLCNRSIWFATCFANLKLTIENAHAKKRALIIGDYMFRVSFSFGIKISIFLQHLQSSSRSKLRAPPPKRPLKKLSFGGSGISVGENNSPIISSINLLYKEHFKFQTSFSFSKFTQNVNVP